MKNRDVPAQAISKLLSPSESEVKAWAMDLAQLLKQLSSSSQGLSQGEAECWLWWKNVGFASNFMADIEYMKQGA